MTTPLLIASSKYSSSTAEENPTINLPAGIVVGELLVAQIWVDDEAVSLSTPAGWTLEDTHFPANGRSYLFSKIADASEGSTLALTTVGGTSTFGAYAIRTNASVVDGVTSAYDNYSNTPVSPDLTTTSNENLIIRSFSDLSSSLQFNASLAPAGTTSIEFDSAEPSPTGTFVSFQAAQQNAATAGAVGTASWGNVWGGGRLLQHTIALAGVHSGLDTEPTTVKRGETGVVLASSAGGFGATQGTGSVTYGGQPVTVVSWSDTSMTIDIPPTIALQHYQSYPFAITPDGGGSILGGAIPFQEQDGYVSINIVNPDTADSTSILFGYSGDAPVTGDQVVFESVSSPDSIPVTVSDEGYVTLSTTPSQTQTIARYVIQADGTLGTEADYTLQIAASGLAPTMQADANVTVIESATVLGTFAATAGSTPISYSLSGVDAASFNIDVNTGAITFVSAPDYEVKNNYQITVTATNTAGNDSQNIAVSITNLLEQTITDGGDITLQFPYGGAGLSHEDASLQSWIASYVGATSNTLNALPDPLTAEGSPYQVTFTLSDAPDVSGLVSVVQAGGIESDAIIASFQIFPGVSTNTRRSLFPDNTHVAEVFDTRWAINESLISDATVTLTLTSSDTEIPGQTWPIQLAPILNDPGIYRAVLSHELDLSSASGGVDAELLIVQGLSQAKYNYPLKVKPREK
jgi:hypothetical protein